MVEFLADTISTTIGVTLGCYLWTKFVSPRTQSKAEADAK